MDIINKKIEKTYYRIIAELDKVREEFESDPKVENFEKYTNTKGMLFEFNTKIVQALMEGDVDLSVCESYSKFSKEFFDIIKKNEEEEQRNKEIVAAKIEELKAEQGYSQTK